MVVQAECVLARLQADEVWAAALAAARASGWPVFVVGGTVRDALLGRDSYDLDLAIAGPALAFGRSLADSLRGAFYPLDVERDVARVLVWQGGRRRQVDVAGLRARGIAADLRARDFTVNAIALPIGVSEAALLDPTGGLADLERGTVRLAGAQAFSDDPLRVLRLARLRTVLGFQVEAATEQAAREAAPTLARVTPERVRDETLALLALPGCVAALRYAADLGLLGVLYGAAGDTARFAAALAALETVTRWQIGAGHEAAPPILQSHAARLADYWAAELATGRPRWLLTRVALLVTGCAADEAARRACLARLRLSQREAEHVAGIWAGSARLATLRSPDDLALHRYYRQVGEAGVAGAVVALAVALCRGVQDGPAAAALAAWFERHDTVVAPLGLVSGGDLVRELGLAPGPCIGRLLAAIREAQVLGAVRTPSEALALAARLNSSAGGQGVAPTGGRS